MQLYVIQDTLSKQSTPIFIERNEDTARRSFQGFLKSTEGMPPPSDYDLFLLGEYDPVTLVILSCHPNHVVNGASLEASNV